MPPLPDDSGTIVGGFVGSGTLVGTSVGAEPSVGGGAIAGSGVAVGVFGVPANDERIPGLTLAYAAAPKLARKVSSAAAPMVMTYFNNSVARTPSVMSVSSYLPFRQRADRPAGPDGGIRNE